MLLTRDKKCSGPTAEFTQSEGGAVLSDRSASPSLPGRCFRRTHSYMLCFLIPNKVLKNQSFPGFINTARSLLSEHHLVTLKDAFQVQPLVLALRPQAKATADLPVAPKSYCGFFPQMKCNESRGTTCRKRGAARPGSSAFSQRKGTEATKALTPDYRTQAESVHPGLQGWPRLGGTASGRFSLACAFYWFGLSGCEQKKSVLVNGS